MKRIKVRAISSADSRRVLVVVAQVFVVLLAGVLVFSLLDRFVLHPPAVNERTEARSPTRVERLIQVSVRNECGVNGIALAFTSFLRKRGFDVVETTNGTVFDRPYTTVIDASGNYQNALRVAGALGVEKQNVISKLDPRSYVDVEVLIGRDFSGLKPNRDTE